MTEQIASALENPSELAAAQQCYMIVTPSVLNSNGVRDHDGNHIKWFLKFGDGNGETPTGRYVTHNPDYEIQSNRTGRAGTFLRQQVLENRGFAMIVPDGFRSEWYVLWERPDQRPPITLSNILTSAIDAFANYNLGTQAGRNAAATDLVNRIPRICNSAPP
ncbi:uncharacterized protein LAESUDRAFT_720866 [Laetiporus sulphureus 93-53]|uniref:Uncharacterized protein n=1 Tax=Laetiporus sulphureus 93-53 TaxID=1314785 RepID=A0A165HE68_9APHY|nr:uncharacterized protein LAESUDRAFT_720866 [Laetiporus sulphureus 93-53]KZT11617.1 hypothetical protein LAESUDRAFT_720866 [Laetiporus sulphureus 93-53]